MSNLDTEIIPTAKVIHSHHPWKNRIKDKYCHKYIYSHNSVNNPTYPRPKEDYKAEKTCQERRTKFTVIGNRVTKAFIYCLYLVKGLFKYRQKHFEAPIITGVTGVEWPKVWNDLKIRFGESAYCLNSQVAVLKNDQFLGGEDELTQFVETKYVYRLYLDYNKEGIQQFANYIKSSGRSCAYLQISINKKPIGSFIFMLYSDIAPLTCQNFLQMCEKVKGGYGGSPIHRIVKDCWIQCGGYDLKSPTNLVCENFIVPHDSRGVLCMANDGRNVDCSTQFFVLLQPAPWMEKKYVAFGQLIDGEKTLSQIENVPTWYESPMYDITIDKAAILNMDCQKIPINKNVNAYIQGHIENLVTFGLMIYEALLQKVFTEIELRIAKKHQNVEEFLYDKYATAAGASDIFKKEGDHDTIASGGIVECSTLFELKTYEENVLGSTSEIKPLTAESSSSILEKPVKPFYLPLTDVPYPGEVDSIYNLEKFMRGDYCLESDLEKFPKKAKLYGNSTRSVPAELIGKLFDYLIDDTDSLTDSKADLDFKKKVGEVYRDNLDRVSLAGRVVKKMATLDQLSHKDLLEGKIDEVLSDETLRMIRVVTKESKKTRKHIKLPVGQASTHKICRRQTGMFPPRDIKNVTEADEVDEIEVEPTERIDVEPNQQGTSLQPSSTNDFKSSVLQQMFRDVAVDYEPDLSVNTFQNNTEQLRDELANLHSEYNNILDDRDKLQRTVDGFDACLNEYIQTLNHVTSLKRQLFKANSKITELESVEHNHIVKCNNSLFSELVGPVINDAAVGNLHSSVIIDLTTEDEPVQFKKPPEPLPSSILMKRDSNVERKCHHDVCQLKGTRDISSFALNLQPDKNMYKIYSEPVTTNNKFEFGVKESMKIGKHSKKRPSLTMAEYQMKNQKYREDLKLQKSHNN